MFKQWLLACKCSKYFEKYWILVRVFQNLVLAMFLSDGYSLASVASILKNIKYSCEYEFCKIWYSWVWRILANTVVWVNWEFWKILNTHASMSIGKFGTCATGKFYKYGASSHCLLFLQTFLLIQIVIDNLLLKNKAITKYLMSYLSYC